MSADGSGHVGAVYSAIADLAPTPGLEVVTTLAHDVVAGGGLNVRSSAGDQLWNASFSDSGAGPPIVGDLDGDGQFEIYVAHGFVHDLWTNTGTLRWRTSYEQTTLGTNSIPLAADISGDGVMDILQVGTLEPEEQGPPLPEPLSTAEAPVVFGLDGRDGTLLFEHELSCGKVGTRLVGIVLDGVVTVLVGCTYFGSTAYGTPGSTVEALRFEPQGQNPFTRLLVKLGLLPPFQAHVAWAAQVGPPTASLWQLALADVHPGGGDELVAIWNEDEGPAFTALTLDGTTLFEVGQGVPDETPGNPAIGDLDGDGLDEVVLIRPVSRLITAYSPRASGLSILWSVEGPLGPERRFLPAGASLADFDSNGEPEIIAGWQGGAGGQIMSTVRIYSSSGDPLWSKDYAPPPGNLTLDQVIVPIRDPSVGDLDQDGRLDFVYAARGRVLAFFGQ